MTPDARDEALAQLEAARVEQDRLADMYRAAVGTSSELRTYHRLRDANGEVAAREARFKATGVGLARGVPS
jgi:hypothetical protein